MDLIYKIGEHSILKYNISLDVEEVPTFLKVKPYSDNFLVSVKNIDTIKFDKTI